MLRTGSSIPTLTLDAGALLFKSSHIPPQQLQQSLITARGIVEAYNLMAYDAVGISGRDLAAGLEFLQQMQTAANFPWLSANLVRKTSGQAIFTPSLEKKTGDLQIGIIGLTGTDGTHFLGSEDATIRPWQEVLPPLVSSLLEKDDLIILLSGYPAIENEKISETVPGLHLIIQAGAGVANFAPKPHGDSLFCQTGPQGKYLGVFHATWRQSKRWGFDNLEKLLGLKRNERDGINSRLVRYRHKSSDVVLAGNKDYQQQIKNLDRVQEEIAKIESDMRLRQGTEISYATYDNRFITMRASQKDDKAVLALVENIQRQVNEIGRKTVTDKPQKSSALAPDPSANESRIRFVGYSSCQNCHGHQTLFWQGTRHAKAYRTLVRDRQQYNLDCLPCHVTADPITLDASLLNLAPEFQLVGCETCHGAGKIHASDPSRETITRLPSAAVCLRCHTEDRDNTFDYRKKIPAVSCPSS